MTRGQLTAAWQAFAETFTREARLPGDARGEAATAAALRVAGKRRPDNADIRAAIERRRRPTALNDIRDERVRRVIAAVALKHDTTSAEMLGDHLGPVDLQARDEAAWTLSRGECHLGTRGIGEVFGASHTWVRIWIKRHEERASSAASEQREVASG